MKNEILDSPFRDSFQDFLEKGETIIWQGQPVPNLKKLGKSYYENFESFKFWGVTIIVGFILLQTKSLFLLIPYFLILFFLRKRKHWVENYRNSIHYALTQKRALFKFKKREKTFCYSLPYSEIKKVSSAHEWDLESNVKVGVVYFEVENVDKVNFTTRSLRYFFEKRYFPTFELIKNPRTIVALIEKYI